jgi:hypothetical protein
MSVRDIIQTELTNKRSIDVHTDSLCEALEKKLSYEVFNSCCCVMKQIWAGVPEEKIKESFSKLFD